MVLGLAAYLTWGWTAMLRRSGVIRPAGDGGLRRVAEPGRSCWRALAPGPWSRVGAADGQRPRVHARTQAGVTDAALARPGSTTSFPPLPHGAGRTRREPRAIIALARGPGLSSWAPTTAPDRRVVPAQLPGKLRGAGAVRRHPRGLGPADRGVGLEMAEPQDGASADARAAEAQCLGRAVYARALERLYEANLLPAVQASKGARHIRTCTTG